jgi:uncharacterized protein
MIDAASPLPPPSRGAGDGVEPFLFRGPEKSLYGCLHRATTRTARHIAVVLCQPFGPEYIRSHRAMRQLASRLARVGCTVLRFDSYGCGDSAGDDEQGDVEQWTRDANAAIDEMRARVEADELVVIGLRLGGSLATLAGSGRQDVDRMVLWDPIIRGQAHLDELREGHSMQLAYLQGVSPERLPEHDRDRTEILGFSFGPGLVSTLAGLDLLTTKRAPAPAMLVIESRPAPVGEEFAHHLERLSARVEHRHLPDHEIWMAAPDTGVVPGKVLHAIVSWVARTEG